MNNIQAIFQFEEGGYPPFIIQCTSHMKMGAVIDSFKNKVNADGIHIEFNDYYFCFNDKTINRDLTLEKFKINTSSSSSTLLIISVRKRSRITKCPDCECNNTCFLKIENYGLKFYGCPYNHNPVKTFAEYENSQKINYGQIKCDKCKGTLKEKKEMLKCLNCSKEFKRPCHFCNDCNKKFNEENGGDKHKTIKYDDKNYICLDGYDFISYCLTCQIDLCEICEKKHKNHDIIKYDSMKPNIKEIKRELEEIKNRIAESKAHIEQILRMLEDASTTLDNYYFICMDIIGKYESYNSKLRNFHVIKNINSLKKSNKIIIEQLDNLLIGDKSKDDYLNKCRILFDIFISERGNFINRNAGENKNQEKIEVNIQKEKNNSNENLIEDPKIENIKDERSIESNIIPKKKGKKKK